MRADDVGLYRFKRKILAGWHLLQCGRVDDHLGFTDGLQHAGVFTHIADAKRQQFLEIAINHFICGRAAVQIG